MTRLSFGIAVGALVLAGSIGIAAQAPQGAPPQGGGGAPAPPMTNLQVFPKDIGRPQVLQAMQAFSAALGVTCVHCHVFNGPGDDADGAGNQSDGPEGRTDESHRSSGGRRLRYMPSR